MDGLGQSLGMPAAGTGNLGSSMKKYFNLDHLVTSAITVIPVCSILAIWVCYGFLLREFRPSPNWIIVAFLITVYLSVTAGNILRRICDHWLFNRVKARYEKSCKTHGNHR